MNEFEGMDGNDFRMLSLQAQFIHLYAKSAVYEDAILRLFERLDVKTIEGKPVSDYIQAKTKEMVSMALATASDHDPNWTTKLAKMVEAIDRGHV